jgi:hypothetical protein
MGRTFNILISDKPATREIFGPDDTFVPFINMMPEIWLGSASLTNEKSPLVRNLAMAEIETIEAFNGSVFSDCFSALNASPADEREYWNRPKAE